MGMSGYPETVVVSSQGPAAEMFPLAMGVYTMTDVTHSDRPVWRGRNGSIVFNGSKYNEYVILSVCLIFRQDSRVANIPGK